MLNCKSLTIIALTSLFCFSNATAGIIGYDSCTGAVACLIAPDSAPIPNPISANPNNDLLLGWDEIQDFTLTSNLYIDLVADFGASYIGQDANGTYVIAGTTISSHYFQWDSSAGSNSTVNATINFDAEVFGFISSVDNLVASDDILGLSGFDYTVFNARGLENQDSTLFSPGGNNNLVDISWIATSPGDWGRAITASAGVPPSQIPEPHALLLLGLGLAGLVRFTPRT